MNERDTKNLFIFTVVNSVWGVVFGLIGPFYVLFVNELSGGVEKLGFAFSIMVLTQAATSYYAGRFSDRLGRKPFLIATCLVDATVLLLYTVISTTLQLYLLQAVLGITNAVAGTMKDALLGDLTRRASRGMQIGRFNAYVSVFSAAGLAAGGYVVKYLGLEAIFYFASAVVVLSTVLLAMIKEK